MVRIQQVGLGHELHQLLFDLHHIFARRQAGTVAYTKNMSIDGHGNLPERGVEHHIRRFAADTRKCFERFPCLRHLAVMSLDQ